MPHQQNNRQNKSAEKLPAKYILRWFSPRWFIFIMGTGAMANVFQLLSGGKPGLLHELAVLFLVLAIAVFPIAIFFIVIRFFVGLDCILKEWRHSSLIQFYSAIFIAAAICATGLLNIPVSFIPTGTAFSLALVFWWIALVLGLFFALFTSFKIMIGNHAEPRRALGFWFLPPVGLFVVVFAGNFLAMHMQSVSHAKWILFLNTFILGAAIPMTVVVFTVVLFRALFYNFPRKDVAPSFMIGVAPIGVSIVAINTYLPLLKKLALPELIGVEALAPLVKLVSLLLWGFGLWWLLIAVMVITYYFIKQGVPVTLGYWAFIFPPTAYTIATLILAKSLNMPFMKYFAVVMATVLATAWTVNLILTVRGMINRTIFDVSPTFKGDIPYL
jgi:C4-dicarboxylate transporter/malic acid transport protein